jgi:hypothetical protein
VSNKTTEQEALAALRRDSSDEGDAEVEGYLVNGVPQAAEGSEHGQYVDLAVVDMDGVGYFNETLTAAYQTGTLIGVEQFRAVVFFILYTPGVAGALLSVIPQVRYFRGNVASQSLWMPMGVVDGSITVVTPNGLSAVYGSRKSYGAEFRSIVAPNVNVISWPLPLAVDYYMAIRLLVAEVTPGALGSCDIRYATVR